MPKNAFDFSSLKPQLSGDLYFGKEDSSWAMRKIFSTDASVYQELPEAVIIPKTKEDLIKVVQFAAENKIGLIARAAGTSLAGQVVGSGIVIDTGAYFKKILELNTDEGWVYVEPGVIRNDLNAYLKPFGFMFGPETSTASRAMIGGMIGNNSCGLHSIVWGDTRENVISLDIILTDGSTLTVDENSLETISENALFEQIRLKILAIIDNPENQIIIKESFPDVEITRRNTGYALDQILDSRNICKLLTGSEGTLCLISAAKLKIIPLPPKEVALVNVHFMDMRKALESNLIALEHRCYASELVDDVVLEFTYDNPGLKDTRSFVEGKPKAILMVEFFADTKVELESICQNFISDLKSKNLGYTYPILYDEDTLRPWELRKAALGLLSNQKGDSQPINLIEDFAVKPEDLPDYIDQLEFILKKHNLKYSISAHAGAGELHVIPMMNLKTDYGVKLFRDLLAECAVLVKKYKGSLSGEHGDGRLRGEFIPFMMGEACFKLFKEVKVIFDPNLIFNPGKITDSPKMNTFLRVQEGDFSQKPNSVIRYEEDIKILAEKCNGSGECRKTHLSGGTMCPSFMASGLEPDSTRARANMLRHYYNEPNAINLNSTKEILDRCLSCKACQTECPAGVDVGKMKADFTQSYYDLNGVPLRAKLISNFSKLMFLSQKGHWLYNALYSWKLSRNLLNTLVGFHKDRSMPLLYSETLKNWIKKRKGIKSDKKVALFIDEFTNYNDLEIGKKLVLFLEKLNFEVICPDHFESGRTYLSKGFLKEAKKLANKNVKVLSEIVNDETPLIGIEPSAILSFRDEYLDLVDIENKDKAVNLAKNTFLFEEWFLREIEKGHISKKDFTNIPKNIKIHGHCHQKALVGSVPLKKMLNYPENYKAELIPSGCCGMAGSFGYEKEHYDLSIKVAELVLMPTIRSLEKEVLVAAPGTSCRHQIHDAYHGYRAYHPIEIMYDALV